MSKRFIRILQYLLWALLGKLIMQAVNIAIYRQADVRATHWRNIVFAQSTPIPVLQEYTLILNSCVT